MSITAALAIAKATGLDDWVLNKLGLADSGAGKLAKSVIDLAQSSTKENSPKKALVALQENSAMKKLFESKVLANQHELMTLAFADKQNARQMYQVHHEQNDRIAERIMKYNPLYIAICLLIQAFSLYFLRENPELLSLVTSILTMAIKSFFDERKEVCCFHFGSSMGSKQKDQNKDML